MTDVTRSTMLPSFQQLLGVTSRGGRQTGRRLFRRSAIALGALGTLGTLGLLACNTCTFF